jgi:hypothetical protein
MSGNAKLLVFLSIAATLGGCASSDIAPPQTTIKTVVKPVVKERLKLNDHLIGVATLSGRDALQAEDALDKNGIPYGTFVDINSIGIVVKSENADRARTIIREDSRNRGYKLLERITPTPEYQWEVTTVAPFPPKDKQTPLPPANHKLPSATVSVKHTAAKLVTVVALATKDAKLAIVCLKANGVKAPGTWETDGISGIVVPEADANHALALIQADARLHHYNLLSKTPGAAAAATRSESVGEPASAEDLKSEGTVLVFARETAATKVAECLEAHNISSFARCDFGSCGVYVSKFDADRAAALVQDDARIKGYTVTNAADRMQVAKN